MANDTYSKVLSENLKSIRRSKGLTTTDLAKVLGVSQAKISYIEHCKGVLSARDIAILARRLDVPVTEFFRGLDKVEDHSAKQDLAAHLVHYGANLLAKPSGILLKEIPFEEVFSQALGFVEDDRLHKGFCAALITQAAKRELNVDRIFALIGNNPFLVGRVVDEVRTCLQIIEVLNRNKQIVPPRAERQLQKILTVAKALRNERAHFSHTAGAVQEVNRAPTLDEIGELTEFVSESLHAKK